MQGFSAQPLGGLGHEVKRARTAWQMMASSPLRSTRFNNFRDGPLGLLSPTSHFCTVDTLVFSPAANTA
jgi:hypothetical protein